MTDAKDVDFADRGWVAHALREAVRHNEHERVAWLVRGVVTRPEAPWLSPDALAPPGAMFWLAEIAQRILDVRTSKPARTFAKKTHEFAKQVASGVLVEQPGWALQFSCWAANLLATLVLEPMDKANPTGTSQKWYGRHVWKEAYQNELSWQRELLVKALLVPQLPEFAPWEPSTFPVAGTIWDGTDSDGRYEVAHFALPKRFHYASHTGHWMRATWKQTQAKIYIETNNRYAEYRGDIKGLSMAGNVRNPRDNWTWSLALYSMGEALLPSLEHAVPPHQEPGLDVNSATVAELQTLKGIGYKRALKLIEYRHIHGPVTSPQELLKVWPVRVVEQHRSRLRFGEAPD